MKKRFVAVLSLSWVGAQFVVSPSLFAADLSTISQRNKLIVAVKDNVRPLGFRDAKGNLQGFEIEIAQRLAQELLGRSTAIEFKLVSNRDRLSVVTDEKVDFAIARITANSSRARIVAFSEPYYLDGTGIITKNAAIQTQRDLTNQTIAVLNNASTIATLRYRFPQTKLVGVESYEAGKQLIESGKAIAFAADVSVLVGWAQEFPEYRVLPFRISTEPLAIVFPKGIESDQLRRSVDQILRRWKSEGWLQQRATYWGLP